MSVREYIGARYVPLFADPIEWDNTRTYEPLTIVYYQGNSYTSRQAVPTGIAITNETYWALTGNYNAQIEAYREEVSTYSEIVSEYEDDITALNEALPIADFGENNTVSDKFDEIESNSWVTTNRIADLNVTEGKLANSAVTQNKLADGAVTQNKIGDGAVSNGKYANSSVSRNKMEKRNIIVLGDSWNDTRETATEYTKWPAVVNETMYVNIINYSRNGAMLSGTTANPNENGNLLGQINAVIADNTFNHNNVDTIIICGGVNDFRSNVAADTVKSQMYVMIATLKSNFPNARIVTLLNFMVCVTKPMWTWIQTIKRNITLNTGTEAYSTVGWVSYGNFISDFIHPNNTGYKEFAGNVLALLNGGSFNYIPQAFTATNGSDFCGIVDIFTNDEFKREINIRTSSSTAHKTTFTFSRASNCYCSILTNGSGTVELSSGNLSYLKFGSCYCSSASATGFTLEASYPDVAGDYYINSRNFVY